MININIDPNLASKPEIEYVMNVWALNAGQSLTFADGSSNTIKISSAENATLKVEDDWTVDRLSKTKVSREGYVLNTRHEPDFLLSAFYLINSLQEFSGKEVDELGRFKFQSSHQYLNGTATSNIVQHCFDEISQQLGLSQSKNKSNFFLSHDIDLVNSAILEDGFNVLKKGRIDQFFTMLINVVLGKPDWLNMDKIMQIESEYDCKSVFYWIVNNGVLNKRERNADYTFKSQQIQKEFNSVEKAGFENSIHKSISHDTFEEEFEKYGGRPFGNRYHYLKFSLPQAYYDIEDAGLCVDASLGFAEQIGFRNSYGLPFNPYNFAERRPFRFVEVPLHVMDRTFFQYQKMNVADAEKKVINFFEKNNENCVLSVLWHNNFFTNYKFSGYLDLYKKILSYIYENNFKTLSQRQIVDRFSIIKK